MRDMTRVDAERLSFDGAFDLVVLVRLAAEEFAEDTAEGEETMPRLVVLRGQREDDRRLQR